MCYSAMIRQDLSYLERTFSAHWLPEQVDQYLAMVDQDSKRYPPLDSRIFPGHYAPIIYLKHGQRHLSLMRYGAYPPPSLSQAQKYTTYNARRDNLTSRFWAQAFKKHHGVVILRGFYEWVAVKDLIHAGRVSLADVQLEFDRQRTIRRNKILASGKPYKPTPTEVQSVLSRRIVIQFQAESHGDLIVPVIFSFAKIKGQWDVGFAIVTDVPPSEIAAAGHDRCPLFLSDQMIDEWMTIPGKSTQDFDGLLSRGQTPHFTHDLDRA